MRLFELALLAATASTAAAQAVTAILKPTAANPPGCRQSMPGSFNIFKAEIHSAKKRDTASPSAGANALQVYLNNTVLTDSAGRTGAIVANFQFQFDGPPQAGTLYTAGFCLLPNNSLVLGNSAVWWSCNSGGFDNLYDRWWAAQCQPVLLNAFNTGSDPSASASGASASSTASHSGVLTSSSSGNATVSSTASASSATSKTTTTTGSATKQSTVPAPSATSSHAAAPTGSRIGGMAIAAGLLGVAML